MMHPESKNVLAARLIHSEHGESTHMVRVVQSGGMAGGVIGLVLIACVFVYLHVINVAIFMNWYQYILWAVGTMTFVFVASIVGMLVGVLYSLAHAQVQQALHHREAIADALLEISMRKRIRKLMVS